MSGFQKGQTHFYSLSGSIEIMEMLIFFPQFCRKRVRDKQFNTQLIILKF